MPFRRGLHGLDLNFSPSTNLLPIRRLDLSIGEKAGVRAAWLRFPGFALEPLEQVYSRLGDGTYRYESGGGRFVAELEVDRAGFVTRYPNLWEIESGPDG
ncbi:MAG: putative glycolipid-binding domain-containing protein [Acidobacteriota bacterium]|nr:putative glycolipid-binding domain-containing protein [Acidobacteriota bacterium]